jgi:hypothetical protein
MNKLSNLINKTQSLFLLGNKNQSLEVLQRKTKHFISADNHSLDRNNLRSRYQK